MQSIRTGLNYSFGTKNIVTRSGNFTEFQIWNSEVRSLTTDEIHGTTRSFWSRVSNSETHSIVMMTQPSKLYFQKGTSVGIMEKGGEKKPVRKEITNSMSGDRFSSSEGPKA